jgi:uncharacterized protein YndB with AHSA1/START domain
MAERGSPAAASVAERELTITRRFEAPRELVFKAWSERDRVLKWLGPTDFKATEFEMERRVGGAWRARMVSPDGNWYGMRGMVREIVEPERLVFTFAWDEDEVHYGREMLITITFEERDGGTEMTFHQAEFEDKEDRDGHNEGWSQSFDRLEAYLASL